MYSDPLCKRGRRVVQTSLADKMRSVTEPTRLARRADEAERPKTKEAHTQTQKKNMRLSTNMSDDFLAEHVWTSLLHDYRDALAQHEMGR